MSEWGNKWMVRFQHRSRAWRLVTCSFWTRVWRSTNGTAVEPARSRRTRFLIIFCYWWAYYWWLFLLLIGILLSWKLLWVLVCIFQIPSPKCWNLRNTDTYSRNFGVVLRHTRSTVLGNSPIVFNVCPHMRLFIMLCSPDSVCICSVHSHIVWCRLRNLAWWSGVGKEIGLNVSTYEGRAQAGRGAKFSNPINQRGERKFLGVSYWWLGRVVVRALDLQSTGRGFDSRPPRCRVATLGKSFASAQRLWSYDRMAL